MVAIVSWIWTQVNLTLWTEIVSATLQPIFSCLMLSPEQWWPQQWSSYSAQRTNQEEELLALLTWNSRVHGGFCLWVVPSSSQSALCWTCARQAWNFTQSYFSLHTVIGTTELTADTRDRRAASCDLFQSDSSLISLLVCSSLFLDFYSACNLTQTS